MSAKSPHEKSAVTTKRIYQVYKKKYVRGDLTPPPHHPPKKKIFESVGFLRLVVPLYYRGIVEAWVIMLTRRCF